MYSQPDCLSRWLLTFVLSLLACVVLVAPTKAQDTVTGAFEGRITNSRTGAPIAGASIQFINQATGVPIAKRTDQDGRFYQGLLQPGTYIIRASAPGFKTAEVERRLLATRNNAVIPIPITLEPETAPAIPPTPASTPTTTTPATTMTTTTTTAGATSGSSTTAQRSEEDVSIEASINQTDARQGGAFTEREVLALPLGATTLVRSFDELALLLPGVALPPQTLGIASGPGIGPGVGSAGQFAVNGLRSRANNFTVDGSDNNDEDIGVRRQGFFSLVPQPVESIREFQVITLLAPAQFGRNIGAQVNAISKSGGNEMHGTLFGFFNSSQLNARNFFDTTNGNAVTALRAGNDQAVLDCGSLGRPACIAANRPLTVTNQSGGEDSFTLGQGGFAFGGPLKPERMFYFVSAEGQLLNASREVSFAVPTVEERGLFGTGATAIFRDPILSTGEFGFPTSNNGDAIFSLFPFSNNPTGIYGRNTFTQTLPSSGQGKVVSGKFDGNFKIRERVQTFTARYNITDDWRDIPVTGGAIFSRLRPRVRTQNFSTFLNSEVTDAIFNQVRLSYGRTRLIFDEGRDPSLLPSDISPSEPFLLNARRLLNNTLPANFGVRNSGPVLYQTAGTVEGRLGRLGQVNIAGYSPVGVDVFNFPQRRVNNTYQVADTMTWRTGAHSLAFGTDIRRTELNSDLPRNSRTFLTFNGAPELDFFTSDFTGNFINPVDFAAAGAPSGAFLSLARAGSAINLRYYQLDFFGQDEWRIRRNLSLSYGLRYEYNTPPREVNRLIENTFGDPLSNPNVTGLRTYIGGRSQIYEPDRNNFAPRVGFAYSPDLFGHDKTTVIRAGYGLFFDQILGAVVSQSRNVFPRFITVNTGGFTTSSAGNIQLLYFNPSRGGICFGLRSPTGTCLGTFQPLVQPGTLNTINPALSLDEVLSIFGSSEFVTPFGATLPARNLKTPMAHHYSVTIEQQLSRNMVVSAAYIGTLGRHLLRTTTPNLGPNNIILPIDVFVDGLEPIFLGFPFEPGFGRPTSGVGAVTIYTSDANSRYDALQLQARGRFAKSLEYQVNYTFSKATDDASDVFDLAGAPALPQDSLTFAGERGPSNFDVRHRFSYNLILDLPTFKNRSAAYRAFFGGFQLASTGQFQTGQPFTVNSIFDVNLDGNLTDRLNSTAGLVQTGNRAQPLQFTGTNKASLLAPIGSDGSIGRNTFRAGNILELDLAVIKQFKFTEQKNLVFRMDIFNFINRANYGIPVRFLEAPGFGQATETVTPGRRIQFALKYNF